VEAEAEFEAEAATGLLDVEPPAVPGLSLNSERSRSICFLLYSSGIQTSLLVLDLFVCDPARLDLFEAFEYAGRASAVTGDEVGLAEEEAFGLAALIFTMGRLNSDCGTRAQGGGTNRTFPTQKIVRVAKTTPLTSTKQTQHKKTQGEGLQYNSLSSSSSSTMSPTSTSGNPFLATSNETYGLSLVGLQEMAAKEERTQHKQGGQHDLSFLYRRESDRIGEGIPNSDSALAAIMSTKMPQKSNSGNILTNPAPLSSSNANAEPTKEEIEQALASFQHNPKEDHPLYMTTANEIGRKAPSYATYTVATKGRSQTFSNSFNGVMYTDESLAT
jgi:hypothetical protein